jgi:hypothetical protein
MIRAFPVPGVNPPVDALVGQRVDAKTNPDLNSRSDARARAPATSLRP